MRLAKHELSSAKVRILPIVGLASVIRQSEAYVYLNSDIYLARTV